MTTTKPPSVQPPASSLAPGSVTFQAYAKPVLPDGDYRIKVSQSISGTDGKGGDFDQSPDWSWTIAVRGPRFSLDPSQVQACFPPQKGSGEYLGVLPHVVLDRITLPWERAATPPDQASCEHERAATPPDQAGCEHDGQWLALLLFSDADALQPIGPTAGTVEDLSSAPDTYFPSLCLESGQSGTDPVTYIDLRLELFEAIAPTAADLDWISQLRTFANDAGGQTGAAVICNRMAPVSGARTRVHLVSLEGYGPALPDASGSSTITQKYVRLISLYSWSFTPTHQSETFTEILSALDTSVPSLQLPAPTGSGQATIADTLALGYVGLPHALRNGDRTVSWYRGPFAPWSVSPTNALGELLPASSPDELSAYDETSGMLDVSYSTAWQAGRLLAASTGSFAAAVGRWRTETLQGIGVELNRAAMRRRLRGGRSSRAEHYRSLLRRLQEHPREVAVPTSFPDTVVSWLASLMVLDGVPISHLLPHPALLPTESIRFFVQDPNWVAAMIDGALSVGRITLADKNVDKAFLPSLLDVVGRAAAGGTGPYPGDGSSVVSGLLLRSKIVSGWPNMQINAWDDQGRAIASLASRTLAPNLQLALFVGEPLARVDIHEPPLGLHFGVTPSESGGDFTKVLRDPNEVGGSSPGTIDPVPLRTSDYAGVVCLDDLASTMSTMLGALDSGGFALQMVEGVQNVHFSQS